MYTPRTKNTIRTVCTECLTYDILALKRKNVHSFSGGMMGRKTSLERYCKGITINIPCGGEFGDRELLGILEVRRLLGVSTRETINTDLKAIKLFGRDFINWEEVRQILKMRLFLSLRPGYNSREMYLLLSEEALSQIFEHFGIDVDAHLERIQQIHRGKQRKIA